MNNKGGCGKTTTVWTIGDAWARMGKKILFVDLDSQSNLTSVVTNTDACTQVWEKTIEDSFVGGPEYGLPIQHVSDFIDIVPADLSLSNFEQETASHDTREWMLFEILEPYKDQYDFILIDCPPALGLISSNALVASDYLVIVANPDGLSERGANMVLQLYNRTTSNKRLKPELQIAGFILTRTQRDNVSQLYEKRFREQFGVHFIEPTIRRCTKLVQSVSFRTSLFEFAPEEKAAQEYLQVAAELLQRVVIE